MTLRYRSTIRSYQIRLLFKHTDKEDVFSKIQYALEVLSNKVSQGTRIIL